MYNVGVEAVTEPSLQSRKSHVTLVFVLLKKKKITLEIGTETEAKEENRKPWLVSL